MRSKASSRPPPGLPGPLAGAPVGNCSGERAPRASSERRAVSDMACALQPYLLRAKRCSWPQACHEAPLTLWMVPLSSASARASGL
eukprot:7156874-Alexandrium_andersonii.AAC.1